MPVVYYGDEQGFTGDGGDKDAGKHVPSIVDDYNDNVHLARRRMLRMTTLIQATWCIRPLLSLVCHRAHKELRGGVWHPIDFKDPEILAHKKQPGKQRQYLVAFNISGQSKSITWNRKKSTMILPQGKFASKITIPSQDFVIIKSPKELPRTLAKSSGKVISPEGENARVSEMFIFEIAADNKMQNKVEFSVEANGKTQKLITDYNVLPCLCW